jgi:anion-transporting  ArsA/GET3 family ATPase
VIIVAGKGGVGKTTVSAALARMAARSGMEALIVEIEGKSGLAAAFGRSTPLDYHEVEVAERVRARTLTPDDALIEYLEDHGMRRLSKRLMSSGAIDVVATAAPGIKDILVLGKVKQLERNGAADLIVVDAPAAGHAVTFLASAHGLMDAVQMGPIRSQAQDVIDLLTDPSRCEVLLVTLAEETPVNEVVETAFHLEDRVGVSLMGVVVNGLYGVVPGLDADPEDAAAEAGVFLRPHEADALRDAAAFRSRRQALQAEQVARLAKGLPLPQLPLPFLFSSEVGPADIETLAAALEDGVKALPDR